jgi:hypothetical protein
VAEANCFRAQQRSAITTLPKTDSDLKAFRHVLFLHSFPQNQDVNYFSTAKFCLILSTEGYYLRLTIRSTLRLLIKVDRRPAICPFPQLLLLFYYNQTNPDINLKQNNTSELSIHSHPNSILFNILLHSPFRPLSFLQI